MVSVKNIMVCVGIDTSGRTSVLGDLFGFSRERVPTDPDPATIAQVSLLDHVRALQNQHIHVNVIRVGFDRIGGGRVTLDRAHERLDYAVYRMRTIYRQVGLGVGRVLHHEITAANANGYDDLGSEDECDDLVADFSIDNDGVDAFVVRHISEPGGLLGKASDIPGTCNKQSATDGVVAGDAAAGAEGLARTFAHEIGHHLGLCHPHGADCPTTTADCNNLMAQTGCATTCGDGVRVAVNLTAAQGNTMRGHCSVRGGCS